MKVLYVYIVIVWILSDFIRTENLLFNTLERLTASTCKSDSRSGTFAEVYDENPTMAKVQAIMGNLRRDPDEALTCGQIIKSRGFDLERHYVITVDGYIIQVHRIINPYARSARECQKPVLLSHGFAESCINWLYGGPDGHIKPWIDGNPPNDNSTALGFLLANVGIDVWIINARGTTYSTNHTYLDPYKDPRFWDYSFQDIALYDITSVIKYMKKETGREQITVIGHSQGVMQQFVQMSVMPEFEKNYDIVILAAPIGFFGNLRSILGIIPHEPQTNALLDTFKIPFPPKLEYVNAALGLACQSQLLQPICLEVVSSLYGSEAPQMNISRLPVLTSEIDQSSMKNIVHYGQSELRDHLSYFDHGPAKNIELYGSPEAPNFPFHRINVRKIALITAINDPTATEINVQKILNSLNGTVLVHHIIRDPLWGHLSFLIGVEQYKYFGKVVLDIIRKYGSD